MISQFFSNRILSQFSQAGLWVSLHTSDPGATGANELKDCARYNATGVLSLQAGALKNNANMEMENLPTAKITHIGIWDSPQAGHFLAGAEIDGVRDVLKGDSIKFPTGKLAMTVR